MSNIEASSNENFDAKKQILAFVANRMSITAPLPFEIAPECYLDRASPSQVSMIKKGLEYVVAPTMLEEVFARYEMKVSKVADGYAASGTKWTKLPESEWRYYVVSTPGNGTINHALHHAANISDVPLDLATLIFHGENGEDGRGHRPHSIVNFMFSHEVSTATLDATQLVEISQIYDLLIKGCAVVNGAMNIPKAWKAVEMLDDVTLLPHSSAFRVLGLFSILEMLISHNPRLEDKGDSITHQMKTKMPLLMRRFDKPVVLAAYFGEAKSDKIWSQMYGYRSAIAHGGTPDFKNLGAQGYLRSAENANAFLFAVVKATIRNYLREPVLYDDLVAV